MQAVIEPVQARSSRGFAVLALVALAWTQLALATHRFEHPDVVAFDACGVCLQLERCDQPLSPATTAVEIDAARFLPEALPAVVLPAALPLVVRQRGPPAV